MRRTEELLATKFGVPMLQDGQDHQVLLGYDKTFLVRPDEAGRVSANEEETTSHDLVRKLSLLVSNESTPAEIVISALLRRALDESASTRVRLH